MVRSQHLALLLILAPALLAPALRAGNVNVNVDGDWREPGGSILHVFSCGPQVCMRVMTLRPNTPHFDTHNPDPAKRTQPLCGLQIGYAFQPQGPDKAFDGRVYDPQSGRIYRGEMHTEGDVLHLRGYILFPVLGRSEQWKRVPPIAEACHDR